MLNARIGTLFDNILFIELHIAAIEHRVLCSTNVNKRSFHARKNVLYTTEINVAVYLRFVISRTRHIMLNETLALEHRDLSKFRSNLYTH